MFESQPQTNLCCAWPSVHGLRTFTGVVLTKTLSTSMFRVAVETQFNKLWVCRVSKMYLSYIYMSPTDGKCSAKQEENWSPQRVRLLCFSTQTELQLVSSFCGIASLFPYIWVPKQNAEFASVSSGGSSRFSPSDSVFFFLLLFLIPQSSTAALVYSNQGSGRRQPKGIFTLEYEICCPLGVVESQSQLWFLRNTKQNNNRVHGRLHKRERKKKDLHVIAGL